MQTVSLLDLPHRKAAALLATGVPVYVTVNPVEYHGPHLSLHNDRWVALGLCRRIHAELAPDHPDWPLVLADDLEIGHEACKGSGSRVIDARTEKELVLETARSLAELGARRVVLMTFHGGPLHNLALDAAVRYLGTRGVRAIAPLGLVLSSLVQLVDPSEYADALEPVADAEARARLSARLHEDFHAGFFETSMALALAPHTVDGHLSLPACPAIAPDPGLRALAHAARLSGRTGLSRELELAALAAGWGELDPFPGYTSEPAYANAASGEAFVRHALRKMMPLVRGVLERGEEAPAPPMAWLDRLTWGGRLLPPTSFAERRSSTG
ncbi:MAG: creatininase family protein [Polyangiales bacterium]